MATRDLGGQTGKKSMKKSITLREAAGALNTTEDHVMQLADAGVISSIRIGSLIRFDKDALVERARIVLQW